MRTVIGKLVAKNKVGSKTATFSNASSLVWNSKRRYK